MFKKILLGLVLFANLSLAQTDIHYPRAGVANPNWRDPVTNVGDLPTINNNVGDARVVKSSSELYIWNGSTWVLSSGGGGGSGVTNGDPATGFTPGSIQYVDQAGNQTEDAQFTRDSVTKKTLMGAEIPAAYAADNNLPNPFAVLADNFGDIGNSVSLIFDGVDDVDTVVAAWNSANPSNTVTVIFGGAEVPDAQTVTLKGGGDSGYNLGEYGGGVIFGNVFTASDPTNQVNSIFGQGNLSGFTGAPWGNAFFVQDLANNYLTGFIQGVQNNSLVSIDLASFSYFSSMETSQNGAFIQFVDNTTNSGFYAEPSNKTYIKVNSNDYIFPTSGGSVGDILAISSQTGQEFQLDWITPSGGGGSPTNDPNSVQVNDGTGGFLGINNFTYDNALNLLTLSPSNGIKVQPASPFYQFGEFSNTGLNSSFIFDPSNRQLSYDVQVPVYSGVGFVGFGGQNNLSFDGSAYAVSDSNGSWDVTIDTPAGLVESGTFFLSAGLNDATFSGTYTGTGNGIFNVTIDGTGAPDTFSWSINGNVQVSNIPISAGVPTLLQDGISVTFAASTGHNFNAQTVTGYGFGVVEYVATSFIGGDIAQGVTVTGSISGSTADVAYYSQGSGQVILTNLSAPFTTNDVVSDGVGSSALLLVPNRYNATYDWTFNGGASHPNTPMIANNAFFALNTGMNISFTDIDSNAHEVGDNWNWSLTPVNALKINSLNQDTNNTFSIGDTQQAFGVLGQYSYIDLDLKNATTSIYGKTVSISGALIESTVDVANYGTVINLTEAVYDLQIGASGSGATTVNLPINTTSPIGTVYIVSDLGANCSSNNITIDAGSGNFIVGLTSAQTLVMSTDGQVVRLKKVTATQWKVE